MAHVDALDEAFPSQALGGKLKNLATLDAGGTVVQTTPLRSLTVGALHGESVLESILQLLEADGIALEFADDDITSRPQE